MAWGKTQFSCLNELTLEDATSVAWLLRRLRLEDPE